MSTVAEFPNVAGGFMAARKAIKDAAAAKTCDYLSAASTMVAERDKLLLEIAFQHGDILREPLMQRIHELTGASLPWVRKS